MYLQSLQEISVCLHILILIRRLTVRVFAWIYRMARLRGGMEHGESGLDESGDGAWVMFSFVMC